MAAANVSSPTSPTASFSPRPRSLSLSHSFKDRSSPDLASPLSSPFSGSASFKRFEDTPDRFDIASLKKSFSRTQIWQDNPSRRRNVNALHSDCSTGQREPSHKETYYGQNGIGNIRKTCYSILNVHPSASPKEIRLAYRKLALQFHPDVAPLHLLDSATRLFSQINDAYAILSDPQRRKCYDLELAINAPTTAGPGYGAPRKHTIMANGRVYPSMNSLYREWRATRDRETDKCCC